ncbi:hypothetical protein ABZX51_010688 [Aspergillus tubingensis]
MESLDSIVPSASPFRHVFTVSVLLCWTTDRLVAPHLIITQLLTPPPTGPSFPMIENGRSFQRLHSICHLLAIDARARHAADPFLQQSDLRHVSARNLPSVDSHPP